MPAPRHIHTIYRMQIKPIGYTAASVFAGQRRKGMPLSRAPQGTKVEVKKICAEDRVQKHLGELGILPGAHITVLSSGGGNVILKVKEGRLCIDGGLASRITVAPVR